MTAEARLATLAALPLYLNATPGRGELPTHQWRAAWPTWRANLQAQHPRQRPASADLLLLSGLTWAPGMLHLASAFVLGARLDAQLSLTGTPTAGQLHHHAATLTDEVDPLPAALGALQAMLLDLHPATTVREDLLLRAAADRLLQVLGVLGRATGDPARAQAWGARFHQLWPVRSRAELRFEPEERLVRATCCFAYLNEGLQRCSNCPTRPKPPAHPTTGGNA